jgi:hypothetical protein
MVKGYLKNILDVPITETGKKIFKNNNYLDYNMHRERVALEALRNQYVVSFAGFCGEFRRGRLVGIEERTLQKTDLIPYIDKVIISKLEQHRVPFFLKEYFTVVPITEEELDVDESLLQQELGLAVLPEKANLHEELEIGDKIILNAALSRKLLMREKGGDPERWARNLLRDYLLKGRTNV